jgi:lipid-binding SYLF domain-containing protein
MRMNKLSICLIVSSVMALSGCGQEQYGSLVAEAPNPPLRPIQANDISDQVAKASRALSSVMFANDALNRRLVTDELLSRTKCIIALSVTKGAFGLGGGGGEGLMACRHPNGGWSAPSFVRTGQFDLSIGIGFQVMSIGIFITSDALAEAHMGQLNVSTKAYLEAVAADAAAAIRLADRFGAAVIQNTEVGLMASIGLSFQSISHMQAQRNQVIYGSLLNGGAVPVDVNGRPCSDYLRPRLREACEREWVARTGGGLAFADARRIFSLAAEQAPMITQPFNDRLRSLR